MALDHAFPLVFSCDYLCSSLHRPTQLSSDAKTLLKDHHSPDDATFLNEFCSLYTHAKRKKSDDVSI